MISYLCSCCKKKEAKQSDVESKVESEELTNESKISDLLLVLPTWNINTDYIFNNDYTHKYPIISLFKCTPTHSNMFFLITKEGGKKIPLWFWNKYSVDSDQYGDFVEYVEKE